MSGGITKILRDWDTNKDLAIEQLTPLVYGELHKIASSYMRGEGQITRCKQQL